MIKNNFKIILNAKYILIHLQINHAWAVNWLYAYRHAFGNLIRYSRSKYTNIKNMYFSLNLAIGGAKISSHIFFMKNEILMQF